MRLIVLSMMIASAALASDGKPLWHPYRITERDGAGHIVLDGRWQLAWREAPISAAAELESGVSWFAARVPSSVQWALHESGKLPHPYHNLNALKYEWVEQKVWYYRRTFDTPRVPSGGYVFLCFDGIDYFARVWLNGELLGRHEGMFGGPAVEVGRLLRKPVANELVVEVRAGNYGKPALEARALGNIMRPWIISHGSGTERFFPLGIWQGVRLEVVPRVHLERPLLTTRTANPGHADLALEVEVLAGSASLELNLHPPGNRILSEFRNGARAKLVDGRHELRIELTDKASGQVALSRMVPLELYEGQNWVRQELRVANPKLWWPNGMGAPNLYTVRLTLDGSDALAFDFGIRTIETRPSAGPKTQARWRDWQFVVNGRPLFVKGINWTMTDLLLDMSPDRYRWLLEMARAAGIQWIRANGAFLIETETFHRLCDEMGLMVEQEFPLGNQDYPDWPQDIWEAQAVQNIFRMRNHASVVLWSGGNEFNPYSKGNTPIIGILERSLSLFDGSREFLRSDPDEGAIHPYLDVDPCWYSRLFRFVPFVSEAGMHSIPDPRGIREVVDAKELDQPLGGMYTPEFAQKHPDFVHHFTEFNAVRVPRMLSRASHIDDMRAPSLEAVAEASQIGAGEFYQVISDGLQANYPVTTGLLPWVFQRFWPVAAIMLVDGFGQPAAPYYFLKRTYEQTHVAWVLPHLLWAPGESVPAEIRILDAGASERKGLRVSARVVDLRFQTVWKKESAATLAAGPSVTKLNLGSFQMPAANGFVFLVTELTAADGALISRSVYWPRCLESLAAPEAREKIRGADAPWPTVQAGPWLKPEVAKTRTSLALEVAGSKRHSETRSTIELRIRNTGPVPVFPVELGIEGVRRSFHATDNFFWLAPGEDRRITVEVLWRERPSRTRITAKGWNADLQEVAFAP